MFEYFENIGEISLEFPNTVDDKMINFLNKIFLSKFNSDVLVITGTKLHLNLLKKLNHKFND